MKISFIILLIFCFPIMISAHHKISGSGASFPANLFKAWFQAYSKISPHAEFIYSPSDSGTGIKLLASGLIDFAATDVPTKNLNSFKHSFTLPTAIGAVAVVYNLKNVSKQLKIDGPTLADVFLGKITKWNDPKIVKLNPDINLPSTEILIVKRSDESGTTYIFSRYLSLESKKFEEAIGYGTKQNIIEGVGVKGNERIALLVEKTNGSIGYIELSHARKKNLQIMAIRNPNDEYISPSPDSISKAAESLENKKIDLNLNLLNTKSKGSYPISSFTWVVIPIRKTPRFIELKKFFQWACSEGQSISSRVGLSPLPKNIKEEITKILK